MIKLMTVFIVLSSFASLAYAAEPKIRKLDCPKGTKQEVRWYGGIDTGPREVYCAKKVNGKEVMEGPCEQYMGNGLVIIEGWYHDDKLVKRTLLTYDKKRKLSKKVFERNDSIEVIVENISDGRAVKTVTQKRTPGALTDTSSHGRALD